MFCSEDTIKLLALKECDYIKNNKQFWEQFSNIDSVDEFISKNSEVNDKINALKLDIESNDDSLSGIVSFFDEDFPPINTSLKKDSEKPYILFYKGDITLLHNLNNNVAVIGLIDPTDDIEKRERVIVNKLISENLIIVSGLAKGCDAIAHKVCVENNAKTIAILPTSLKNIAPAANRQLAEEIVNCGGLLVTEYYNEPKNRYEAASRYVERDRLQALFSKAIVMIASYKKGEGDSGSRHAMEYALSYKINRYVMYNIETDKNDKQFGLNRQFLDNNYFNEVKILSKNCIEEISALKNERLQKKTNSIPVQLAMEIC